jgi:hypothetical protein
MKKSILFFLFCSLLFPFICGAESSVPRIERQIVFGVAPFDGTKHHASFLPESNNEMFLVANTYNPVTVLLSDVYYWPITAEYRADFQGVHIPLEGNLSVFRGNELYRELEQVDYIYVYPRGPAGEPSQLLAGEEMIGFIQDVLESYEERLNNPLRTWATFQGPFRGFVLNLPEGNYRLVFSVENEGRTFTMEKKLRVFPPLGYGIAYQIIPDEKWTVSSNSETPQQRIYLKPDSTIYLKLFPTILYNRADYERLIAPHRPLAGLGLENSSIWVHEEIALEDRGQNFLLIEAAGQSALIQSRDFLVRQTEGTALGYIIMEHDPAFFPNTRPTFTAYRLSSPPPGIGVTIRAGGESGNQSLRHLRSLEPRALGFSLLAFVFPFIVILIRLVAGFIEYRKLKE